ncbi:MAG: VOC family protein [Alphaproteobacteria bacterium]
MSNPFQTHSAFSWVELRSSDPQKSKAFYADVIGWDTEEMPGPAPYTILKTDGEGIGGIVALPEAATGAPSHWCAYITVDDVDARTKRAEDAGATVIAPPMDMPGVGRMSTIQDPTGAVIALMTYS